MFRLSAQKIAVVAASALLLCAGFAQAQEPASPLTAAWTGSPSPVPVAYDLSAPTTYPSTSITVTAASSFIFDVDPTTIPFWLTPSAMNATAAPSPGGATLSFQASTAASALGVGTYTANVHLKVSGYQDLVVPIAMNIANGSATLTVAEGNTVNINWVYGSGPLTQTLTLVSSGAPVAFTATAANTTSASAVHENVPATWISLSAPSGVASNFGTPVVVSFLSDVLNNAAVGASLTGTVTFTYNTSSTVVVSFTITVTEPFATVSSILPAQAPPATTGFLSVVVTGTGFGTSGTATSAKIAYTGDANSGGLVTLASIGGSLSYVNPTTVILSIPSMDNQMTPVNVLADGNSITLQVTNAQTGEPAPAETTTLSITSGPIIYSITDAAALTEPPAGTAPSFAPYELVTIFGNNFDLHSGSAGAAVAAAVDSFSRYPNTLTVPATTGSALTVSFYAQGTIGAGTFLADAYLVYVSNTQINALVPSNIVGDIPGSKTAITGLQIVVNYGGKSNTATPFLAKPVAANPAIFTVGAEGQGQGAILLPNYSVNSSTNEITPGQTVMIYVSGLGAPTSTAADTAGKSAPKAPASCISAANYFGAVNNLATPPNPVWASDDGAIILASNIATNDLPPCFSANPTVTIGGVSATVTYAGWVADSVAGLYQINATVPTKAPTGTAVPVVVTVGGVSSQAGVTMAIQ